MRVCVVGCGAVGSLFAANLARLDDVEVWAYDLDDAHVRAINETGLRLSGVGDVHARLEATSDAAALPPCDFGLVAVKSMHTDAALAATARAFGDGAVCSVQNGVGNEEAIAAHAERVIRGTTFPAGRLVSDLVDEGKAVAAAQGVELDADPEELIDHAARPDVAYDHKASMLQDVEARRATEVDFLNGGIVRFGREHGVATSLNEAILALVKGLERSWP